MDKKAYEKLEGCEEERQENRKDTQKKKHSIASKVIIGGVVVLLGLGVGLGATQIKPIREAIEQSDNDVIAGIPGWVDKIPVINEIGDAMNGVVEGVGDVIEDIGSGISKKPYETSEHYEKPVIDDNEELTGEYLVKKLDLYIWDSIAVPGYTDTLLEFGYNPETDVSVRFSKISVPTYNFGKDDYEEVKENLYYYINPFGVDINKLKNPLESVHFDNVYIVNLHWSAVVVDEYRKTARIVPIDIETFESIANEESIGNGKINEITSKELDRIPFDYCDLYAASSGETAYNFFELTREDIINIKDPEVLNKIDKYIDQLIYYSEQTNDFTEDLEK